MRIHDWFDYDSSIDLCEYKTLAGVRFKQDLGRFKAGEKCEFVIMNRHEIIITKDGREYTVEL